MARPIRTFTTLNYKWLPAEIVLIDALFGNGVHLLFIAEQILPLLDEKRVVMVARNPGIRAKEGETAAELLTAFLRKAEEGLTGRPIVETVITLSARTQNDGGKVLIAR